MCYSLDMVDTNPWTPNNLTMKGAYTMAQKVTIFTRVADLAKANIHALLDKAEDPQKMLDQLIRDYTNNIREAEAAVAQLIGNLRLAEKDYDTRAQEAIEWGNKALAASNAADKFRAEGDVANADKYDNLAKTALGNQLKLEKRNETDAPQIQSQRDNVTVLRDGLDKMRAKLEEVKEKRDELNARRKTAQAQTIMAEASKNITTLDATSAMASIEEKVRREEAYAIGQQELATSNINDQFNDLETLKRDAELDDRLAALKAKQAKA